MTPHPEIVLDQERVAALVAQRDALGDLARIEDSLVNLGTTISLSALLGSGTACDALALWRQHDHFVVRGAPAWGDGVAALLLAAALFPRLKTYRQGKIVKHFRMSPWTTALSHTLADGYFHTDINTADAPPDATVMECLQPDPDAPRHGQLRVARLSSLLSALRGQGDQRSLRFLLEDRVPMVNETSFGAWTGTISDGREIRFHPETLRAAAKRGGRLPDDLEERLAAVHAAALSVAPPLDLAAGDILFVSNRRALHYRGPCTVRFHSFPRDFQAREVAVLHAIGEPAQ